MKKFKYFFLLFLFISSSLFANVNFNGKLNITNTTTYINKNLTNKATYKLDFKMMTINNNVKFYSELNILPDQSDTTKISYLLNKAYIKYRIPFKDNYIKINIGKMPISLGGGLFFNAGNLLFESTTYTIPTSFLAQINIPFYETKDFKTLSLSLIQTLPIEGNKNKITANLNYEIGTEYFDNIEFNLLYSLDEILFSTGFKGSLFFDYGIYGKSKYENINDFQISFFLIKVIDKLSLNFEGLYNNKISKFTYTTNVSLQLSDKIKTTLSYNYLNYLSSYNHTLNLNNEFTLVQGLSFNTGLLYNFDLKATSLITMMNFKY